MSSICASKANRKILFIYILCCLVLVAYILCLRYEFGWLSDLLRPSLNTSEKGSDYVAYLLAPAVAIILSCASAVLYVVMLWRQNSRRQSIISVALLLACILPLLCKIIIFFCNIFLAPSKITPFNIFQGTVPFDTYITLVVFAIMLYRSFHRKPVHVKTCNLLFILFIVFYALELVIRSYDLIMVLDEYVFINEAHKLYEYSKAIILFLQAYILYKVLTDKDFLRRFIIDFPLDLLGLKSYPHSL